MKNSIPFFFCGLLVCLMASSASAQNDVLYRIKKSGKSSKQTGKIQEISALSVPFNGRSGVEEIPVWEIEKLAAGNEPVEVEKARDRIDGARYDEALELLDRVKLGSNPITDAEVGFYRAMAMSKMAFSGGSVSAVDAGGAMNKFIKANAKSHHIVPATEMMGRLAMADGKLDFAKQKFDLLKKSNWPEYVAKGLYLSGEALMREKKYPQAAAEFDKLISLRGNDDLTQRYKRLGQCQKAKAAALGGGDAAASIATLETIIKQENPDDKELFACAYNALGSCHLKSNDLAEAQEKFLFTHLLFDSESNAHAEAVYHLTSIWTTQNQTDRASEARQILKSRYRNTWWSGQLN